VLAFAGSDLTLLALAEPAPAADSAEADDAPTEQPDSGTGDASGTATDSDVAPSAPAGADADSSASPGEPQPAADGEVAPKPSDNPAPPAESANETQPAAGDPVPEDASKSGDMPKDAEPVAGESAAEPKSEEPASEPASTESPGQPATTETPPAPEPAPEPKTGEGQPVDTPPSADTAGSPPPPADAAAGETEGQTPAQAPATAPAGGGEGGPSETPAEPPTGRFLSETKLTFDEPINAQSVMSKITGVARQLEISQPAIDLNAEGWDGRNMSKGFTEWDLKMSTAPDQTAVILGKIRDELSSDPVWPSSNKIGGAVAGKMQNMAMAAMLISLVFIVGYIWFRFQKVMFGLAAVIALIHDVAITLGAIAVSYWLANYLGFLLIDNFKISLPVVAAFLTIIGYSLNDTIVVFDRIREVKGKSPVLTAEMVNASINQTLSRTLLTSLTTLIVIVILYALGGQGIHSFAFCLLVGVVVGTYSSIFIAAPFLLWMTGVTQSSAEKQAR
jgi:SecD/SecF fusion protein